MQREKTVRQLNGTARAYEIHMGETTNDPSPRLDPSRRVFGTYVHGYFDDDAFRHDFIARTRREAGLNPAETFVCVTAQRQARIDRWANHLRHSLDLDFIRSCVYGTP